MTIVSYQTRQRATERALATMPQDMRVFFMLNSGQTFALAQAVLDAYAAELESALAGVRGAETVMAAVHDPLEVRTAAEAAAQGFERGDMAGYKRGYQEAEAAARREIADQRTLLEHVCEHVDFAAAEGSSGACVAALRELFDQCAEHGIAAPAARIRSSRDKQGQAGRPCVVCCNCGHEVVRVMNPPLCQRCNELYGIAQSGAAGSKAAAEELRQRMAPLFSEAEALAVATMPGGAGIAYDLAKGASSTVGAVMSGGRLVRILSEADVAAIFAAAERIAPASCTCGGGQPGPAPRQVNCDLLNRDVSLPATCFCGRVYDELAPTVRVICDDVLFCDRCVRDRASPAVAELKRRRPAVAQAGIDSSAKV